MNTVTFSIFVLAFSCGFGVTSILTGNFNHVEFILLISGILVSNLLLVEKSRWSACISGSKFRRFVLYIFE
jgi:uncharacterized membrane protein